LTALVSCRTGWMTRRTGWRTVLVVAMLGGTMLSGAGVSSAATSVTCTLLGGPLNAPVSVQPSEQVQLVLTVPTLGTRVNVGPAQSVGSQPGERLIQGTVTGVIGLTGQVCQALVVVQEAVSSAVPVPLPPITAPTLPPVLPAPVPSSLPELPLPELPVLPSEELTVPLPGAEIGIDPDGQQGSPPGSPPPGSPAPPGSSLPPGGSPPSGSPSLPGSPASPGGAPFQDDSSNWGFKPVRIPPYGLSSVPYGLGYRFGPAAAPAFRFGQHVAGYSPKFGILPDTAELDSAGTVAARSIGGTVVALPVLLAILLLASVTGALVRTWAIRRA
jgi:hypothetical protein